ncbi:MAG: recombination-associated protein RdgC [Desulfamplus sp.]|nr:recombination-associated protein RdgC [Desulfamplus sp.]MBF0412899.1 recombination-associated protein RdgC [Desulfamplus sp.]
MGLLSSSVSVARYRVDGKIEENVMETIHAGLKQNAITTIEDEYAEITMGWTPFESNFNPDFEKFTFTFGDFFLFSLRIDKKSVPSKIIQKHISIEVQRKLKEEGRQFLSKNEKTEIKENVTDKLMRQMPSTPNIYDVLWNHEAQQVLFFSTQKAANEELETMFTKSFKLRLIRLFPFTIIEGSEKFSDEERDMVLNLAPANVNRGKVMGDDI